MDDIAIQMYKAANSQEGVYPKAIANFLFREVIEDVHSKYNISQEEMKEMCREIVNRAALFLEIQKDPQLMKAFSIEAIYGIEWDKPQITEELGERMDFYKDIAKDL